MLTEVKVYGSPELPLDLHLSETDSGRPETDTIQIRNTEGLDPVNASVSTSPYGSVDGASHTGSSVETRNIVFTLGLNPNWDDKTYASLRRLVYSYFMPKRLVRLEFYSDDIISVEISGLVEDVSNNMFSKDPEIQVSIVCPSPHFKAIDPIVLTGETGDSPITIDYKGSIESGINVKVTATEDTSPTAISIQIGDPAYLFIDVSASIDDTKYLEMSSIPLLKFVRNVDIPSGDIDSLLGYVNEGGEIIWPVFAYGENKFSVITDVGVHNWELTYYERYGGL